MPANAKPKRKRTRNKVYSGPSMTRQQRWATGHPIVSFTLSVESLGKLDALVADGYCPAREGRSGAVRRAIDDAYEARHGSRDPADVLASNVSKSKP